MFALLVGGFIGGNQVNVVLLRKFSSQQIFVSALLIQTIAGAVFFTGAQTHVVGLRATLLLFFVFLSCIGLTYPNAAALGLARFGTHAGRASALLGFFQTGTGALITMGIGLWGVRLVVGLLFATSLLAMAVLLVGRRSIGELVEGEEIETALIH